MSPQRRIALASVAAAVVLIAIKLVTGLATGSLGLLSEAAHSGTDLVAALLTLFAVGVAVRPADRSHPYGHGKAEHLAALAEASLLVLISLLLAFAAIRRLIEGTSDVDATWYALLVTCVVIVIDASRALVSHRAARRYRSPAFAAGALHFGGDLAGSTAVLLGLLAVRAGHPDGDAVAGLFVAVLVLVAAGRLISRNVDVLMDRAPGDAVEAARSAIEELEPTVTLRRLRMRNAAGRHFADVVVGVPPGAAVGQGHAAADAVEQAVERAVPGADVVVHVEPAEAVELGERATAAALRVPGVREVHNVSVLDVGDRTEIALHLKLPGLLPLAAAHEIAESVERGDPGVGPRGGRRPDAHRAALRARRRSACCRRASSRRSRPPSARSSARRSGPSRVSCAFWPPTAAWSPFSPSGWPRSARWPRRTRARARSRSASAGTTRRSST